MISTASPSKYLTLLAIVGWFVGIQAQPWILEVSGCSSQYKFFMAKSHNGACVAEDVNVWTKLSCSSNEYFSYSCSDSACTNCTLNYSRKLQGCHTPPNFGVYCSNNEPNYAIYAGPHYLVETEYSDATLPCTGSVLKKTIWKVNYCAAEPAGKVSYLAKCSNAVDWQFYGSANNCSAAGTSRTEPVDTCVGNIVNTCV